MLRALWRWLTRQKPPPKLGPTPWSNPDHDVMGDLQRAIDHAAADYDHKVIAYPPAAEQTTQEWVTERLKELTGGLTRHPADRTQYPTPPTEADLAAREYVRTNYRFISGFSKGMSMRYLGELQRRAEKRDRSLSAEDLMALRARGLA